MSDRERWTEPGRSVTEDGRIIYAWPAEGRFRALWQRIDATVPDDEKGDALALLKAWQTDNATLIGVTDVDGDWHDVEPDWSAPQKWMEP